MKCRFALCVVLALALSGCSEIQFASHILKTGGSSNTENRSAPSSPQQGSFKIGKPYTISGTTYYPKESYDMVETGIASWYGPGFHGGKTASGEIYDSNELTAAHRTLQMPSLVRVTNLENGRSVIVRINDRGPYARGRVIDVSSRAADLLGMKAKGTARVRLEVLPRASLKAATMAKNGQSTKGIEIAANEGRFVPPAGESALPVHEAKDGRIMPDPVVTQMPVRPSSIFVQVGSFSVFDNAERLKRNLSALGAVNIQEAQVRGRQFYRVRIGPVPDVASADRMLDRVSAMGYARAITVVDD